MTDELNTKVPSVSLHLKEWLKQTGHSVGWLLEKFHASGLTETRERTVRKIVNGEQNPTAIQIQILARVTGVSADRLLDTGLAGLPEWVAMLDPGHEIRNALFDLDELYGGRRAAYHLLVALKTTIQLLIEQDESPERKFKSKENATRDLEADMVPAMKDSILKRLLTQARMHRKQ